MPIRVRYVECDPMGYVHHSAYAVWFEMARTELLRRRGIRYRDLEQRGVFIVVARLNVSFHKPGKYDDELTIKATLTASGGAKIEHDYQVMRGDELLCTASTVLACVGRDGRPMRVPIDLAID